MADDDLATAQAEIKRLKREMKRLCPKPFSYARRDRGKRVCFACGRTVDASEKMDHPRGLGGMVCQLCWHIHCYHIRLDAK